MQPQENFKCSPFRRVCIFGMVIGFVVLVAAAHFTFEGAHYVLPALRGLFLFVGAALLPLTFIVAYAMGCCGLRQVRENRQAHKNKIQPMH